MLFVEREYDIPIRYKDDLFILNFQVGMDQHEGCYDNKYQAIDDFAIDLLVSALGKEMQFFLLFPSGFPFFLV